MSRSRRLLVVPAAVALVLGMTACDDDRSIGGDDLGPTTLIASATYASTHPDTDVSAGSRTCSGPSTACARRRVPAGSVTRTTSPATSASWEAGTREQAAETPTDATGTATAFLDEYAEDLFGVPAEEVAVPDAGETDAAGSTILRAPQEIGGVPVLDGGLVMTVGGDEQQARLNGVRGRVFPDLDVLTDPRLTPRMARREASGSPRARSRPARLVVLPRDAGVLAHEVNVFAAGQSDAGVQLSDGYYYLDAGSGELLDVRPTTAELARPRRVQQAAREGLRRSRAGSPR